MDQIGYCVSFQIWYYVSYLSLAEWSLSVYLYAGNSINDIGRSCPARALQLLSSVIKLGRDIISLTAPPANEHAAQLRKTES